ncbi:hypothetical protein ACHAXR_005551 [Thalassiosira sp. AJA248-18]
MATINHTDPEMAVDGGILELEEDESCLSFCHPLLLRGGGGSGGVGAQQESSSFLTPQTIIEQTLQPDGSIAIKASTMTPHPNGYRDVKIEHFIVPASDAETIVAVAPGSPPPSADYLTRVEYRVLSPGLELEPSPHYDDDDDDTSTVYTIHTSNTTAPLLGGSDNASVTTQRQKRRGRRRRSFRSLILFTSVFIFFIVVIGFALVRDYGQRVDESSDVSPPSPDDGGEQPHVSPGNEVWTSSPSASPKNSGVIDDNDGRGNNPIHHHHHHHEHGGKNSTSPFVDPGRTSLADGSYHGEVYTVLE